MSNCAQPTIFGAGESGLTILAESTAAGNMSFASTTSAYVTIDSEL